MVPEKAVPQEGFSSWECAQLGSAHPLSLLGCSPRPGGSPAYSVLLPVELFTATPRSILFRTSSLRASSRFPGISVPKEPPPAFSRASLMHPGKTQPCTLTLAKSIPLLCSGKAVQLHWGPFVSSLMRSLDAVLAFS